MGIFADFRDYEKARRLALKPSWERNDRPVWAETFEQRRAAMIRLRERWPAVFSRRPEEPAETPAQRLDRVVAELAAKPIEPSDWLAARYGDRGAS